MTEKQFLTVAARSATTHAAAWLRVFNDPCVNHEHRQFAKSIANAYKLEAVELLEKAEQA